MWNKWRWAFRLNPERYLTYMIVIIDRWMEEWQGGTNASTKTRQQISFIREDPGD